MLQAVIVFWSVKSKLDSLFLLLMENSVLKPFRISLFERSTEPYDWGCMGLPWIILGHLKIDKPFETKLRNCWTKDKEKFNPEFYLNLSQICLKNFYELLYDPNLYVLTFHIGFKFFITELSPVICLNAFWFANLWKYIFDWI